VFDANGQALAYVYGQAGDTSIGKTLTLDEARRIAANISEAAGAAEKVKPRCINGHRGFSR
jgi:hypothetical protein